MMVGWYAICDTDVKSFCGSYGSFSNRTVLVPRMPTNDMISVCPSGFALAT